MNRDQAERMARQYLLFGQIFNEITEISKEIDDPELRKLIRRGAADALCSLREALIESIVPFFPDLDPDESGTEE